MTYKLTATLAACAVLLAACDTANPPTVSTANILAAKAEQTRINDLPTATLAELPLGTASYTGKVMGDGRINNDPGYSYIGDLDLDVAFDGAQEISGEVSNMNLIFNGAPDQALVGTLAVTGNTAGTNVIASANGGLDGVAFGDALRGTSNVTMTLIGDARADSGATALAGDTTVVGTGDFTMGFNGEFFATEN
jgi:hypothetical protein